MSGAFRSASLGARAASALIAVAGLILVGWKFREFGLQIVCVAAILLMVREFIRLSLHALNVPKGLIFWYWAVAIVLLAGLLRLDQGLLVTSVCCVAFLTGGIWFTRNRMQNDRLLAAMALGVLGLTICVLFPYYAIQTLRLPNGLNWFGLHLVIVFAGDVTAYFGGISFGKEKLMPQISPKKTVAGSVSGLAGSLALGAGYSLLALPGRPLWQIVLFALACGFAAQMGDLLLSLIKRVADVKDSGAIMPGHGGVLDRLDGIIVTCPLIYAFALMSETLL
jgi:phosphatidate cytidylyltransferase